MIEYAEIVNKPLKDDELNDIYAQYNVEDPCLKTLLSIMPYHNHYQNYWVICPLDVMNKFVKAIKENDPSILLPKKKKPKKEKTKKEK